MSTAEKEDLKTKLRKVYPHWRDASVDKVAEWITDLRSGKLKRTDPVPDSDGITTFDDLLEDLKLEEFLR